MNKIDKKLNYITDVLDDLRHRADSVQSDASEIYDELDRLMSEVDELEDSISDVLSEEQIPADNMNRIMDLISINEGFTYDLQRDRFIQSVEDAEGMEFIVSYSGYTVTIGDKLKKDEETISSILKGMRNHARFIGGWYDSERGEYLIEKSTLKADVTEAYSMMKEHAQLAAYDIVIGDSIGLTTLYTINELLNAEDDKDRFRTLYEELRDFHKIKRR